MGRVPTFMGDAIQTLYAVSTLPPSLPHIPAGELPRMIDHTLLKPDATEQEIRHLCTEARQYGFATVCINPCYVSLCADLLNDARSGICTVIGFPLGANVTAIKAAETVQAIRDGATEVDMVINIGKLKSGRYEYVKADIRGVVEAARSVTASNSARAEDHVAVKVIIETALLTNDEKVIACELAREAGADFVKTSTGFAASGATAEDVALMRKVVGNQLGIKASGGIRTYEAALRMIASGASRIGASASVAILTGGAGSGPY